MIGCQRPTFTWDIIRMLLLLLLWRWWCAVVYGLGFNKEARAGEFLIPYAACLYRICELTLHLLLAQHSEHVLLTIPTRVHRQVHLHVDNVIVKCIVMKSDVIELFHCCWDTPEMAESNSKSSAWSTYLVMTSTGEIHSGEVSQTEQKSTLYYSYCLHRESLM